MLYLTTAGTTVDEEEKEKGVVGEVAASQNLLIFSRTERGNSECTIFLAIGMFSSAMLV